jgi:hypothetical protein
LSELRSPALPSNSRTIDFQVKPLWSDVDLGLDDAIEDWVGGQRVDEDDDVAPLP